MGLGGVGSYAVEALARSGIGTFTLIDGDVICESNINRQLFALVSTIGCPKAEIAARRVRDINPDADVRAECAYFDEAFCDRIDLSRFDYVIDAVDDVNAKVLLAVRCTSLNVPVISCMGAGNRLDPMQFKVCDIYSTSNDPLARSMRCKLRKAGVERLKVVCSVSGPISGAQGGCIGSVPFVPSVAGLLCAGEVVMDLLAEGRR